MQFWSNADEDAPSFETREHRLWYAVVLRAVNDLVKNEDGRYTGMRLKEIFSDGRWELIASLMPDWVASCGEYTKEDFMIKVKGGKTRGTKEQIVLKTAALLLLPFFTAKADYDYKNDMVFPSPTPTICETTTPTPTPTPTCTITATPTFTPSILPSPTAISTRTTTPIYTPTPRHTITATPSPTATRLYTPVPTQLPTVATPVITASPTQVATSSPTQTPLPTTVVCELSGTSEQLDVIGLEVSKLMKRRFKKRRNIVYVTSWELAWQLTIADDLKPLLDDYIKVIQVRKRFFTNRRFKKYRKLRSEALRLVEYARSLTPCTH